MYVCRGIDSVCWDVDRERDNYTQAILSNITFLLYKVYIYSVCTDGENELILMSEIQTFLQISHHFTINIDIAIDFKALFIITLYLYNFCHVDDCKSNKYGNT